MGELKNRERYGGSVDKKILKDFRELAEQTRIPATRLLDEAIEDLIKKHKDKNKDSVGRED